MKRFSAEASELLAIGDNPLTDAEGARRMGITCILVGADKEAQFDGLMSMIKSRELPFLEDAR